MNWNNLLEWTEADWKELEAKKLHHPNCKDTKPIPEGYTPRLRKDNSRIDWLNAQGQFGPQCATGIKTNSWQKKRRSGEQASMEEVLERLASEPDDEAAKRELAALTLKQLARIATGRGAQQLRALELVSDMGQTGLSVPKVEDPDECPLGQGKLDCPICGGRHQPAEIYMSDNLLQSLDDLEAIKQADEETNWPRQKQ